MPLRYLAKPLFSLDDREFRIVILSASYFFMLLCAYYILRPIRETMGISRSAEDLPYLFLGTMTTLLLLAPAIGALVSKYPRNQFIPMAYRFVASNLLIFFVLLKTVSVDNLFYVGIAFYVWLSVVNMLMISLFWGFMSDGISMDRSKRLFPMIAVGGTVGAILGSTIAQQFIDILGQSYLLLVSVVVLELAVRFVKWIDIEFKQYNGQPIEAKKEQSSTLITSAESKFSQWISGVKYTFSSPYIMAIAGYIFFYGLTSTFLYFQQGHLVAQATSDSSERTQVFANIDLWANSLTLVMQLFISGQLLRRVGIGFILAGLPLLTLAGFIALSLSPTLTVIIIFQAVRRSLNYGLFKPAREILFTVIPSEQKYKAKTFVDSFVYRGGDAIGALSQKVLTALQLAIGSIALIVVPIAAAWSLLAIYLGKSVKTMENSSKEENE